MPLTLEQKKYCPECGECMHDYTPGVCKGCANCGFCFPNCGQNHYPDGTTTPYDDRDYFDNPDKEF